MLGPKYIQGCIVAFILLSVLSGVYDGVYLGNTDYGVVHTLTDWRNQGLWIIKVPLVLAAFIEALPQMLTWNYGFLQSIGAIGGLIRLLLFAFVSAGFVWGFFTILMPIAINLVTSLFGGFVSLLRRF